MCSQYSNDINIYGIKTEIHLIIHSQLGHHFYKEMYLINMNHSIKAFLLFSIGDLVPIIYKLAKHKRANLFPSLCTNLIEIFTVE